MSKASGQEIEIMEALLDRGGMQDILDRAALQFENPLFVSDIGFKIIGFSNQPFPADDYWDTIQHSTFSEPDQIRQIMQAGDFERVYTTDLPWTRKYPFADKPFMAARIRSGKEMLGHVCVYAAHRDFRKEDEALLITLCKVISYEMLYQGQTMPGRVSYYPLLTDLIEGRLTERTELETRMRYLHTAVPERMRLYLIRFSDSYQQSALYYIRENLLRSFPKSLSIVYGNEILCILDDDLPDQEQEVSSALAGYESSIRYRVGVSDGFSALLTVRDAYRQAEDAVSAAHRLGLNQRCSRFADLKIYRMLLGLQKQENLTRYRDPVIVEILDYDERHNTSYFDALDLYLRNGKNMLRAAKQASVHKNSMYYRIQRLEELFDLHLESEDTCFNLRISICVQKLLQSDLTIES